MYDSDLEKKFHLAWKRHSKILLTPQHRFHPRRKWRFDFAHKPSMTAIEIQGYGEGHTSYDGMRKDYQKHNEAVRHGWRLLYLMSHDLAPKRIKRTIDYVLSTIEGRPIKDIPTFETTYERAVKRLLGEDNV